MNRTWRPRRRRVMAGSGRNRRRCGFTLLELLVVIGVLAILLSLGLPTYHGIIESSLRGEAQRCLLSTAQSLESEFLQDFQYSQVLSEIPCLDSLEASNRYRIELETGADGTSFVLTLTPLDSSERSRCGRLQLDDLGRLQRPDADATARCW